MEPLSISDVYKIGIGPSSSHTMGPWVAARNFISQIKELKLTSKVDDIAVYVYGSLALTGAGHGTDKAIVFGLSDFSYDHPKVDATKNHKNFSELTFELKGDRHDCLFTVNKHLHWIKENPDELPNKMTFKACAKGTIVLEKTYYSVGGGNLKEKNEKNKVNTSNRNGQGSNGKVAKLEDSNLIIEHINASKLTIPKFMESREKEINLDFDLNTYCLSLTEQMRNTVVKGLNSQGTLPGILKVKRRSGDLFRGITKQELINNYQDIRLGMRSKVWTFDEINTLISSIAMACNEENAAMNAIVTAPTNGACGVVPATIFYFDAFERSLNNEELKNFLLSSALMGILYKNSATVSGAVGGCMAEIGVASSMAAAGLTYLKGGSTEQIFMAAEIAMEHHLGLTCDPIAGLVQIPCIERNAMGVIKAITASNIAMNSDPKDAIVKFKDIIAVMNDTALNMDKKYKETSLGGLAIKVNIPEC